MSCPTFFRSDIKFTSAIMDYANSSGTDGQVLSSKTVDGVQKVEWITSSDASSSDASSMTVNTGKPTNNEINALDTGKSLFYKNQAGTELRMIIKTSSSPHYYQDVLVNTFDTTPPTITITDIETNTYLFNSVIGNSYTIPVGTATDNTDNNVTISADRAVFIPTQPGDYMITYTARDYAGNTSTLVKTIKVYDTVSLNLIGDSIIYIKQNDPYNNSTYDVNSVTIVDNNSNGFDINDITLSITDSSSNVVTQITTNLIEDFNIEYSITNYDGTILSVTRIIRVVGDIVFSNDINTPLTIERVNQEDALTSTIDNNINPIITATIETKLSGNSNVNVNVTSISVTYDNVSFNITDEYTISYIGSIYGITKSENRTVNIVDTTDPIITSPTETYYIQRQSNFPTDLMSNVSAQDTTGENLTSNITVTTDLNLNITSGSIIYYQLDADTLGYGPRIIVKERNLQIIDIQLPQFYYGGNKVTSLENVVVQRTNSNQAENTYLDNFKPTAKIIRNNGNEENYTVTLTNSSSIDTSITGSNTLIYTATNDTFTDSTGNIINDGSQTVTITRIITIQDNIKPILTLKGDDIITLNVGDTYTELGATLTDTGGNDEIVELNNNVQPSSGTVDTTTAGTYTLLYNGSDGYENQAITIERMVIVENPITGVFPTVTTLVGSTAGIHDMQVPYGELPYSELIPQNADFTISWDRTQNEYSGYTQIHNGYQMMLVNDAPLLNKTIGNWYNLIDTENIIAWLQPHNNSDGRPSAEGYFWKTSQAAASHVEGLIYAGPGRDSISFSGGTWSYICGAPNANNAVITTGSIPTGGMYLMLFMLHNMMTNYRTPGQGITNIRKGEEALRWAYVPSSHIETIFTTDTPPMGFYSGPYGGPYGTAAWTGDRLNGRWTLNDVNNTNSQDSHRGVGFFYLGDTVQGWQFSIDVAQGYRDTFFGLHRDFVDSWNGVTANTGPDFGMYVIRGTHPNYDGRPMVQRGGRGEGWNGGTGGDGAFVIYQTFPFSTSDVWKMYVNASGYVVAEVNGTVLHTWTNSASSLSNIFYPFISGAYSSFFNISWVDNTGTPVGPSWISQTLPFSTRTIEWVGYEAGDPAGVGVPQGGRGKNFVYDITLWSGETVYYPNSVDAVTITSPQVTEVSNVVDRGSNGTAFDLSTQSSFTVGSNTYSGKWMDITLPSAAAINSIEFYAAASSPNGFNLESGTILGSTDNSDWIALNNFYFTSASVVPSTVEQYESIRSASDPDYARFYPGASEQWMVSIATWSNSVSYQYYRVVLSSGISSQYLVLHEMRLGATTEVTLSNPRAHSYIIQPGADPDFPPSNAIDDDISTGWHYDGFQSELPWWKGDFEGPITKYKVTYTHNQNRVDYNSCFYIKIYEGDTLLYTSALHGNEPPATTTDNTSGIYNTGIVSVSQTPPPEGFRGGQFGGPIIENPHTGAITNVDGTVVALFNPHTGNYNGMFNAGIVEVFQYNGTAWTQMGRTITGGIDHTRLARTGAAMSSDGMTMIMVPLGPGDGGKARVYTFSGGDWTYTELQGHHAFVCDISADGLTACTGHYGGGNYPYYYSPTTRIWAYSGTSWSQVFAGSDTQYGIDQMRISGDGNTVVSVKKDKVAYIFKFSGGVWAQWTVFGSDIRGAAINHDGNVIAFKYEDETSITVHDASTTGMTLIASHTFSYNNWDRHKFDISGPGDRLTISSDVTNNNNHVPYYFKIEGGALVELSWDSSDAFSDLKQWQGGALSGDGKAFVVHAKLNNNMDVARVFLHPVSDSSGNSASVVSMPTMNWIFPGQSTIVTSSLDYHPRYGNGQTPVNGVAGIYHLAAAASGSTDTGQHYHSGHPDYGVTAAGDHVDFIFTFADPNTWVSGYRQKNLVSFDRNNSAKDVEIYISDYNFGPWTLVASDSHSQNASNGNDLTSFAGQTTEWTPTRGSKYLLVRTTSNHGATHDGGAVRILHLQLKAGVIVPAIYSNYTSTSLTAPSGLIMTSNQLPTLSDDYTIKVSVKFQTTGRSDWVVIVYWGSGSAEHTNVVVGFTSQTTMWVRDRLDATATGNLSGLLDGQFHTLYYTVKNVSGTRKVFFYIDGTLFGSSAIAPGPDNLTQRNRLYVGDGFEGGTFGAYNFGEIKDLYIYDYAVHPGSTAPPGWT